MSTVVQRSKGPKVKQLICFNKGRFTSRKKAEEFLKKLKNRDRRGSARLSVRKCVICSNKKEEIFHVGIKRKVVT